MSLTLVCADDFRAIDNAVAAYSKESLQGECGSKEEGFREGSADTHHTGFKIIALISPNCYQRKCKVPGTLAQ